MIILIYISTHRFKCRLHHICLCLWRAAAITFYCCIQNQKNIRTIPKINKMKYSHFIFSLHTHDTQLTCYISLNWFFLLLLRNYSFFIHQMNCVCVCVEIYVSYASGSVYLTTTKYNSIVLKLGEFHLFYAYSTASELSRLYRDSIKWECYGINFLWMIPKLVSH